ncbi:ovomucoid-like [Ruditapes philippinarum]|uniref:ovomucoid-like n=1 Tax=Ruditapes philippinarum TaxID=129788 RepID=UPI00295B42D7|nr:ovomucoid-like [Ruditapes philippinarum]
MNKVTFVSLVLSFYIAVTRASNQKYDSRRDSCDRICESDMYNVKICGTDGILYDSMCTYDRALCIAEKRGDTLNIYSYGDCINLNSTCDVVNDPNIKCVSNDVNKICASNNLTYDSICEFMVSKCRHHTHVPVRVLHTGACVYDLSTATKLDCSQYAIDNSVGLALENGTMPHLNYHCPPHTANHSSTICLLNGRTSYDACHYCQQLSKEGIVTSTNLVTYIQHTGKCQHNMLVG